MWKKEKKEAATLQRPFAPWLTWSVCILLSEPFKSSAWWTWVTHPKRKNVPLFLSHLTVSSYQLHFSRALSSSGVSRHRYYGQIIPCCWGCPVHCRRDVWLHLWPLLTRSQEQLPAMTTTSAMDITKCPLRGTDCAPLRILVYIWLEKKVQTHWLILVVANGRVALPPSA